MEKIFLIVIIAATFAGCATTPDGEGGFDWDKWGERLSSLGNSSSAAQDHSQGLDEERFRANPKF